MREYVSSHSAATAEPLSHGVLQRKCACGGGGAGIDGECDECRAHALQRKATGSAPLSVPASVRETVGTTGRPLDPMARSVLEPRFNHDFSRVRVHTDTQAGQSAEAVGAAAYTVGRHIAFAPGRYQPLSGEGQSLLAHELAHVIQQESGDAGRLVSAPAAAEREADSVAAQVVSGAVHNVNLGRTGLNLSLAPAKPSPPPKLNPTIEAARDEAHRRVFVARNRVGGPNAPPPPDPTNSQKPYPDYEAYMNRLQAEHYAHLLLGFPNPDMGQIYGILDRMLTALSPGVAVKSAAPGDKECKLRGGYVMGQKLPIVLCPGFFSHGAEDQVRTMVHESAHVAGIGQPTTEGYCALYAYKGPCPGNYNAADSWAQFVNAVTDQPPDQSSIPTGTPPAGGSTAARKRP